MILPKLYHISSEEFNGSILGIQSGDSFMTFHSSSDVQRKFIGLKLIDGTQVNGQIDLSSETAGNKFLNYPHEEIGYVP